MSYKPCEMNIQRIGKIYDEIAIISKFLENNYLYFLVSISPTNFGLYYQVQLYYQSSPFFPYKLRKKTNMVIRTRRNN